MHGELYTREFGFDESFEVHIAAKVVELLRRDEPFDSIWIAEVDGERAGSIAVSSLPGQKAFINFVLVMDRFRGRGVARSLMDVVAEHARAHEIEVLRLETYDILEGARRLYRKMGFEIVDAKTEFRRFGRSFGQEFWEKRL